MSLHSVVKGTGSALPRRQVTNEELAATVDNTEGWVVERTGKIARPTRAPVSDARNSSSNAPYSAGEYSVAAAAGAGFSAG